MVFSPHNLWTKFSERFRSRFGDSDGANGSRLPEVGSDGLLTAPAQYPTDNGDEVIEGKSGALSRWAKKDQAIKQLQEGYDRVTGLIEEVHNHLVTQGERGDRICTSLEQIAKSVSDTPTLTRQQSQRLDTIGTQIETTNLRTQQLAESVQEVPKIIRLQSDSLSGIARQLEMAQEQGVLANQTMDKLCGAIQTLNDSSNAQAKALWSMNATAGEQNDLLTQLVRRQSRLFIALVVICALMAAGSIATTLITALAT
jgi:chromosome segregation ATPase